MARWRKPTQAELALWGTAMRDVQPLDPKTVVPLPAPAPEPAPVAENVVPLHPPVPTAPRVPGGVDRATVERLKRGQVSVEGRIDLHGMDQRAAYPALMGFVESASRAGKRAARAARHDRAADRHAGRDLSVLRGL